MVARWLVWARSDLTPLCPTHTAAQSSTTSYDSSWAHRVTSEAFGHLHRDTDCGDQLCNLECVLPGDTATEGFVRDNDHIPRLKRGVQHTAAEHSACAAHYRSVRAHHESRFLVRHGRRAACLSQVPARTLPRFEAEGSWVVNRSIDHYKIRFLGNVNHIASPNLDVGWRIGPSLHIA